MCSTWPFGPYLELSETYPLNAEVPEEPDDQAMEQAMENVERLKEANPQASFTLKLRCLQEAAK
jgi:7-cyano-7-deazaguanine tRNA-ribosyltransferase